MDPPSDVMSAASDSQAELSRKSKSRAKTSQSLPQTRSQSQKDSSAAVDDVFSQTLQRAEGSSDLRTSETQDRAEHRLEGASAEPMVDTGVPTPPLLTPQHPYETPRTTQPDNKSKYPLDVRRWPRRPAPVAEAPAEVQDEPVEDTSEADALPEHMRLVTEMLSTQLQRQLNALRSEMTADVIRVVESVRAESPRSRTGTPRSSRMKPPDPQVQQRYSPRSTPERPSKSPASRDGTRPKKKRLTHVRPRGSTPGANTSTEDDLPPKSSPVLATVGKVTTAQNKSTDTEHGRSRYNERGIYMPVFKGTNWVAFQIKFDTFCKRYRMDDEEKLERLKLALEDTACRVLYSRDPDSWTFPELMSALESRYGHCQSYPMVERDLRRIKRKPQQTLQDLADEIREVSRKTQMLEHQRDQLTRSAFMGALDDDTQMIHYIDKRDPDRKSLASALAIAERYERENGSALTSLPTRLDAAQVTDEKQSIAAYGSGPSPLARQVDQNAKTLNTLMEMMQQLVQTTGKSGGGGSAASSQSGEKGRVWPGSNYKGKNFIPGYKPSKNKQGNGGNGGNQSAQNNNNNNNNADQAATQDTRAQRPQGGAQSNTNTPAPTS